MSKFRPRIRSRHPSHDPLRDLLPRASKRAIVRLGSTTPTPTDREYIEVNTVQSIQNSANKLRMKICFMEAGVKTADWFVSLNGMNFGRRGVDGSVEHINFGQAPFPLVAKHIYGSRGTGNYLLRSQQELEAWFSNKTLESY